MDKQFDLIVVGGGILGTFHAYHAAKKGLKIVVLEKNSAPQGASVRNFGQVVPSGMNQKWQKYGRESLSIYKEIQKQFDISMLQNGTIYLASNKEELQLIEELHQINKNNGYNSEILTKKACLAKYPGLKDSYCKAGLFFSEEITVEPQFAITRLHQFIKKELSVLIKYNATVVNVQNTGVGTVVSTSVGNTYCAVKTIICNGCDFKILYPKLYCESDLEVAKIQMMQTQIQPNYKLSGSILTGLSIRRYEAFKECPSWSAVKAKENINGLEKKYGVHVLFKQATDGSVIIGDSHQYADAKDKDSLGFFIQQEIDNFIVKQAKKIIKLPNYEIKHRWVGFYSQCKNADVFEYSLGKNIHIVTGIGGKGMTGSAGFSKHNINQLFNY
ncbi:MAG: TIGR03364 family FAD-dependent oxidoreductase [Tenacibaculum sp.]